MSKWVSAAFSKAWSLGVEGFWFSRASRRVFRAVERSEWEELEVLEGDIGG